MQQIIQDITDDCLRYMGKTRFSTSSRKDIFLYRTEVENLFINEFLPDAPGDYVKVFLFGLMYAQFDEDIDSRTMALTLGLTEADVENAWKYWDAQGIVRFSRGEDGEYSNIEFVRQVDLFYGKTVAEEPESTPDDSADELLKGFISQQLREIFDKYQMMTGRTMSRHEARKLTDAVKVYNIEPDVLNFAIDYCVNLEKYSVDYIFKVALRWTEEGCRDVAAVKMMLDKHSKRNEFYRKIFSELGLSRMPTPAEREIMDRWFDGMGFTITEVLEACRTSAGIREPNIRYVNKVLENKELEKGGINTWKEAAKEKAAAAAKSPAEAAQGMRQAGGMDSDQSKSDQAKVSRKVLRDYYDHIRLEEERSNNARIDEVMLRVPEMKDIFTAISNINSEVLSIQPGPEARERRQRMRFRRRELEDEKRDLLVRSGYPDDYLERKYRCNICRDTGYTDEGRVCTCCKERAEEAYRWIQSIKN